MSHSKIDEISLVGPVGNNRNRARSWRFTFNNYGKEDIKLLIDILSHKTQYVFQEEIGEKTGTPHLQGCVRWKNQKDFDTVRKLLGCDVRKCDKWKECIAYCSKVSTRAGKTYTNIKGLKIEKAIVDHFKTMIPRKWQAECLKILDNDPDPRAVHWFYEEKGNTGKSILARHMVIEYGALLVNGKAVDIKYAFSKMKVKPEIVIIDIPRSYANYFTYTIIEELKNGLFFSGKYEGEMVVFNTPHVIVFSNSEPDYEELSKDRWDVHPIDEM